MILFKPRTTNETNQILVNQLNKKALYQDYYAIDTETTGLDPIKERIVQISIVKFHNGKIIDSYTTYIRVDVKMNPSASAVNGITDEFLKSAPKEKKIYPEIVDFLGDSLEGKIPLVAHNAKFDMNFLTNTLKRLGYNSSISYIDTLSLSRKVVKDPANHKLGTLADYFGIELDHAHDAYSDAKACGELFSKLIQKI